MLLYFAKFRINAIEQRGEPAIRFLTTTLRYLIGLHAGVVVSSLISIMALFMGGGQAKTNLYSLMSIQLASIPLAALSMSLGVFAARNTIPDRLTLKRLYAATPQWLVFIFFVLFSLALSGEVSLVIVAGATDTVVDWKTHIPLVATVANSFAACLIYACLGIMEGRPVALSGRWDAN